MRIKRWSWFILICATGWQMATLVAWRWQQPLIPYFFDSTVLSGQRGLDFYSIYQAGYNARVGADIYENDSAKVKIVVPYFTPYRYLPIVAYTLGFFLSLFAPLTAYKLWVVMLELTLWACLAATWYLTRELERFTPLALMWLVFTPYYLELFMGQFSLIQGALVFGMLLALSKIVERPPTIWGATFNGLWLLSVLWKINTIILVPVFLRLRRFRPLGLMVIVVALTTLPYFFIFPAHARDFWVNNFGNTVAGHELGNLGFRQLVFELLAALGATAAVQRVAQLVLVGSVSLLSLFLTFHDWLSENWKLGFGHWDFKVSSFSPNPLALLSLWFTTFFLISPQIWEHHYVMLLPVLVVAYWQKPHWLIFLIWLLLALPTPFGFIGLRPVIAANHDLRAFPLEPVWQPLLQHASKALPTLVLWGYLAWQCSHTKTQFIFSGAD